jgi:hypothetical protein
MKVYDSCCTFFSLTSFTEVSHISILTRQQSANAICVTMLSFSIFSHYIFKSSNEVCVGHGIHPKRVLKSTNGGLYGQILIIPLRGLTSLYIVHVPPSHMNMKRKRTEVQLYISCLVYFMSCFWEMRRIFNIFSRLNY